MSQSPEINREAIITDLENLVNFPTRSISHDVTQPTAEEMAPFNEAVAYLKQRVVEEGEKRGKPFFITEMPSQGRPNLIVGTHNTETPEVAVMIHLDVVKRGYFPFSMDSDGDTARGRGTIDMKFAAAGSLSVLSDIPKNEDGISVSFIFTSDEEVGGKHGAQYLYQQGYRPKFMIVPDGGSPWAISETCKGLWHFRVENVPGIDGHAARPWLGDNAVRKAARFDAALLRRYPDPKANDPKKDQMVTVGLADMGVPKVIEPDTGKITQVSHNSIPNMAFLQYDARFPSQEAMDKFTDTVGRLVAKHLPGATIETDVRYPFYRADLGHPDVSLFRGLLKRELGREPELIHATGNTDAVHFHDVPSFITMAEGGGAHAQEEWVSINGIVSFTRLLRDFIRIKNENR